MEVGVAINLYFPETGVDRGITALAEGANRFREQNNTVKFSLLIGPSSLDRNSVISTCGRRFLVLKESLPQLLPLFFIHEFSSTTSASNDLHVYFIHFYHLHQPFSPNI